MDEKAIFQKIWEQNSGEMRQMDLQRSTLSNIILVLDVAVIGLLVKTDIAPYSGLLAAVLVLLGLLGLFSVAKYYERYKYYKNRAEHLLRELSAGCEKDVFAILALADTEHEQRFPIRAAVKVYKLWYFVHFLALCAGAFFWFVTIFGS